MRGAIQVDGLSKRYRLGETSGYQTFRESCVRAVTAPIDRIRRRRQVATRSPDADVWALKDVSFSIGAGEVVGIVGRNGAGKSTLLKVLSQITQPTRGTALLNGRVGSLLEVGTGFHPELTGRENIFLNGAILGMPRRETKRKFAEIVAFAEVDRFLDTPVKRYSSGMYTRLAFAVASHLEPEILIVDEVLAVGDAAFQKKCLGRMSDVSREGRTVLFVSHNMSAVKALCTRGILMEGGQVAFDGSVDETVNRYLDAGSALAQAGVIPLDAPRHCDIKGEARMCTVRLTNLAGTNVSQLYFGQPFRIGITCEVTKPIDDVFFEISISTRDGTHVTSSTTTDFAVKPVAVGCGTKEIWAQFDTKLLPRDYTIDVGVHHYFNGATCDFVQRTLDFTVLRVAESGDDHYHWPITRGLVRSPARWEVGPSAKF